MVKNNSGRSWLWVLIGIAGFILIGPIMLALGTSQNSNIIWGVIFAVGVFFYLANKKKQRNKK